MRQHWEDLIKQLRESRHKYAVARGEYVKLDRMEGAVVAANMGETGTVTEQRRQAKLSRNYSDWLHDLSLATERMGEARGLVNTLEDKLKLEQTEEATRRARKD